MNEEKPKRSAKALTEGLKGGGESNKDGGKLMLLIYFADDYCHFF